MKKEIVTETKRFPIQLSPILIALCIGAIVLSLIGIGVSVWRIITFGIRTFNDVLKYPFLILICIACIVVIVSVMIRSQYLVQGENLITQFGLVKSKFAIKDITSMLYDVAAKKLRINFGEQYTVLTVNPDWNEELVRAILAVNSSIDYSFTLSDPPEKKDEK